jgi:hypothetical protein
VYAIGAESLDGNEQQVGSAWRSDLLRDLAAGGEERGDHEE